MVCFAAIQMISGPSVKDNLKVAERLLAKAADEGARLAVLPEYFSLMGYTEEDKVQQSEHLGHGKVQDFLAETAERRDLWIVGGTVPIVSPDSSQVYSSCLIYNSEGKRVAYYNKIHLFDVCLTEEKESYQESATTYAGDRVVTVDSPLGKLGIAICYDLRFPELFRALSSQGAQVLVVPSAFTATTGQVHWETLVRARAIENLCYVVAANQGGSHLNGRETHGDSMIVGPWGRPLARLERGEGVIVAEIDLARQKTLREHFPALVHRRVLQL